jgi:uncharacterized protein YpuA (DUF1002 family)
MAEAEMDLINTEVKTRVARPYAVLEEDREVEAVRRVLELANVNLTGDEWDAIETVATGVVYVEVDRPKARNSVHALKQTARKLYEPSGSAGRTPPLIAVPERQFRPRRLMMENNPRVKIG